MVLVKIISEKAARSVSESAGTRSVPDTVSSDTAESTKASRRSREPLVSGATKRRAHDWFVAEARRREPSPLGTCVMVQVFSQVDVLDQGSVR